MKKLIVFLALAASVALAAPIKTITTPQDAFGFQLGADRKLADWKQLTAYLAKLATESNRIRYSELGTTTEGRPFVLVTISAPENLAALARYQRIQAQLADPRITPPALAQSLIAEGKTVLVITCNIHSTEIASSQTAAEFAYQLATGSTPEIQEILRNDIILLVPSLNPDGQQLVVDWYKKYLGTPYEGIEPVVLYNKYVGHDDNRDWYMYTQKETQLAVKLLNQWHPQILYDVHQMEDNGPRLYLPPWVDPIDPNIDPILVASMNAVGMDTARDLTAQGKGGVLVDGVYDAWSPARQYIVYHGGLRLLTESASVRVATPVNVPFSRLGRGIGYDAKVAKWNFPEPWPGGEWHLADIVNYQLAAFFSIAHNAAVNREQFLTNFYTVGEHAVERGAHPAWPYAYVIPARQDDPLATATLVNTLREGGVEVRRAQDGFSAAGRQFEAGSYLVELDQPYGAFAKTLLEVQHYPDLRQYPGGPPQRPYDVTTQTLPLLLGVEAVAVQDPLNVSAALVTETVTAAPGAFNPDSNAAGYEFQDQSNGSLLALFALLKQGIQAYRLTGSGTVPGTIYVPAGSAGVVPALRDAARRYAASLTTLSAPPTGAALRVQLPRIALYQSWVPQMDEGWTRWIFDQDGIPYTRVVDADLRQGGLNARFDVIVIPDQQARSLENGSRPGSVPPEYAGGIGASGLANLKAFVQAGGTLVAFNQASLAFLDWTDGQVSDALPRGNAGFYAAGFAGRGSAAASRGTLPTGPRPSGTAGNEFYSPGSILGVQVDSRDPVGFGAGPDAAIFNEQSPAFTVTGNATAVAQYVSPNPLVSGWLLGGGQLEGHAALADVPLGQGRLILFGFKPQYRAQSESTYRFIFNALLLSNAAPASLGAAAPPADAGGGQ